MEKISLIKINNLISRFSDKSLPKKEWTHQAHIIIGLWHNMNYDFDTAFYLVKSKIKAYNISVGTLNTENSGYHETLTIFWMALTKFFLLERSSLQIEDACNLFLQSEYASKEYPFKYYSTVVLFSKKARMEGLNGDLKEVPFLFLLNK